MAQLSHINVAMDPTTTLMTFMLSTSPSTRSVKLLGSWDNFTKQYPMEKDSRKGQGEWRGCYSFKDIPSDSEDRQSKRNSGLKMGQTYYYYYELDDGIEVHNSSLPSTTSYQRLPGQPVNFLSVPVEKASFLKRSASVGASSSGVKTMNPQDKYVTPRALPKPPQPLPRSNTSTTVFRRRDSRSTSPVRSQWPPRAPLFGPRPLVRSDSAASKRGGRISPIYNKASDGIISFPKLETEQVDDPFLESSNCVPSRQSSTSATKKPFSRAIESSTSRPPSRALNIPTIYHSPVDSSDDDDANFAVAVTSQSEGPLATPLSPPPSKKQNVLSPLLLQLPTLAIEDRLPNLPEDASPSLVPRPLLPALASQPSLSTIKEELHRPQPKSQFSWDSASTGCPSPMDIHHDCFSPSLCGYNANVMDESYFGFPVLESPAEETEEDEVEVKKSQPLYSYGLPLNTAGAASKQEVQGLGLVFAPKMAEPAPTSVSSPATAPEVNMGSVSALDDLLAEMGYLGDMIIE